MSFASNKRFFDDANFPYGFDRSGEFTSTQAQLLTEHGRAYLALAEGKKVPESEEEEAFIQCCNGSRKPQTLHEKTWLKYLQSRNRVMEYHAVALTRPTEFSEDVSLETD